MGLENGFFEKTKQNNILTEKCKGKEGLGLKWLKNWCILVELCVKLKMENGEWIYKQEVVMIWGKMGSRKQGKTELKIKM